MKYQTPETTCLSISAQTIICASQTPEAPGRVGLPNVSKTNVAWN